MGKFVFAFESLKKFRSNKLLIARKDMFVAEAKLRALLESRQKSEEERGRLLDEQCSGELSISRLQLLSDLTYGETLRMREYSDEILAAEKELERHRSWVTHLGRELKIVEKLEDKRRASFEEEQRNLEKRRVDGWVAERWTQKMAGEEQ